MFIDRVAAQRDRQVAAPGAQSRRTSIPDIDLMPHCCQAVVSGSVGVCEGVVALSAGFMRVIVVARSQVFGGCGEGDVLGFWRAWRRSAYSGMAICGSAV